MSMAIDMYSIFGFIGFLAVTAVVILFVSVVGTREKTYEEAIAEQKRKTQEIALQTKTEKPPKEKKKKHPKKLKDKSEKSVESEDDHKEPLPIVPPVIEIIEPKIDKVGIIKPKNLTVPKKVMNQENKENIGGKEAVLKETNANFLLESKNNEINVKQKREKKENGKEKAPPVPENKTKSNVIANKKEEESKPKSSKSLTKGTRSKAEMEEAKIEGSQVVKESEKIPKEETDAPKKEKEDIKTKVNKPEEIKKELTQGAPLTVTSPKKNKKKELGAGDSLNIGTRLVSVMKDAILTEGEMQALIEILLNKQQEGESWVKPGQKIDPLFALKKQLQEKEQALADEKQQLQVASTKLKEARQEAARFIQQDRTLREKILSLQQEMQNAQMHVRHTQEQREIEVNSLKMEFQQLQSKLEADHHLAIQRLEEENSKLQCALTQIEAENKNLTGSEIARLQLELDQWRGTAEQLQVQHASSQKKTNEIQHQYCQLQHQLEEEEEAKNQQEKSHQQQLSDLISQMSEMEKEKNSLHMTIQSLKSENHSIHCKMVNLEKNSTNCNQNLKELETQLRASEEKNAKCLLELESRQHEGFHLADQLKKECHSYQAQIEKLTTDLNKKDLSVTQLQEEVNNKSNTLQRLTEDLETQRRKNNESLAQEVQKEQDSIKEAMERLFPNLTIPSNLSFNEWLHRFEKEIEESKTNDSSNAELQKQLVLAQETEAALTAQVQSYKGILADTESMLHKLQNSVEAEEVVWQKRLLEKETEVQKLKEEKKNLEDQKSALETSLEQIKAAEEAAAEMQEKLRELKEKLQVEEKEKRMLEQRFQEAQKTSSTVRTQFEECSKELEALRKEHSVVDGLKHDIELELEKEKKMNKDLSAQNVKLNSLVRIGQDSLKAEQDTVEQLRRELSEQKLSTTTNGSAGPDVTIEPNNRNSSDMLNLADSAASSLLRFKTNKRANPTKK